jgi:predicted nucleotidyltransferase component of viral defense system
MFKYTAKEINKIANDNNFSKNTCEKVLRLFSILNFINNSDFRNALALKGGTAINLFLLDLPRLSVDIDLDFNLPLDRESMLSYRENIDWHIRSFMEDEGYHLSDKSKFVHTLDSYVYSYQTTSGSDDVLKIEINYSDRVHVLEPETKNSTAMFGETASINVLEDEELIGSKINALITRTTPRDVYDVYNLFKSGLILNQDLIKKIAIFYVCLGSDIPIDFEATLSSAVDKIQKLNYQRIKATLIPVLHKGIKFDVKEVTSFVSATVREMFVLDLNDLKFINGINAKSFVPNALFEDYKTEDVSKHPMGLWKTKP